MFYDRIDELEIENSSICNAACPQCAREFRPNDHSWFKQRYLTNNFFIERISDQIYSSLKRLTFAGVVGDPCASPNFLDVCQIARIKAPQASITISTNGGMKTIEFWKNLGRVLKNTEHVVYFAIDGLEDTNHLYRKNVNWNKVMENTAAFIEAGGNAHWQFIVFKHNEHQIEEARDLAKKMGFVEFVAKQSHRFLIDDAFNLEHILENGDKLMPTDLPEHRHKLLSENRNPDILAYLGDLENSKIDCYSANRRTVYIDAAGLAYPCCYIAGNVFLLDGLNVKMDDGWDRLWTLENKDKINLYKNDLQDVVKSDFFLTIKNSWDKSYRTGKLAICAASCSKSEGRLIKPEDFKDYQKESLL